MSTNNDWTLFLADLESQIVSANKELDDGQPLTGALLEPWAPPENLAPLPAELLDRAQRVNQALDELEVRVEASKNRLRQETQRVQSLRSKASKALQYGETAIPLYIDRSV